MFFEAWPIEEQTKQCEHALGIYTQNFSCLSPIVAEKTKFPI